MEASQALPPSLSFNAAANTSRLHASVTKVTGSYPKATDAGTSATAPGGPSVSVGGVSFTQQGNPESTTTLPFEEANKVTTGLKRIAWDDQRLHAQISGVYTNNVLDFLNAMMIR
jgi:hypothetical protein